MAVVALGSGMGSPGSIFVLLERTIQSKMSHCSRIKNKNRPFSAQARKRLHGPRDRLHPSPQITRGVTGSRQEAGDLVMAKLIVQHSGQAGGEKAGEKGSGSLNSEWQIVLRIIRSRSLLQFLAQFALLPRHGLDLRIELSINWP